MDKQQLFEEDQRRAAAVAAAEGTSTLPPPAYEYPAAAAASAHAQQQQQQQQQHTTTTTALSPTSASEVRNQFASELTHAFDNTAFDPLPASTSASASAHRTTILPPPPGPSAAAAPSGDGLLTRAPPSTLSRSDTLSPSDSISMYEVRQYNLNHPSSRAGPPSGQAQHQLDPSQRLSDATLAPFGAGAGTGFGGGGGGDDDEYPSRKSATYNDPYITATRYGGGPEDEDDDDDYYPRKPGGASYGAYSQDPYSHTTHNQDISSAHLPLNHHGASMGYAEDEEDEARQLKNGMHSSPTGPTPLFSNQLRDSRGYMLDEGAGAGGMGDAAGGGRNGLLNKFGRKSAGGESDMSKVEQQVERRRAGVFRQKYGILAFLLAIAYVLIFIVELIQSKAKTGQAFQTTPSFQPMIGPPFEFFIAFPLGARFVPCMRNVPTTPTTMLLPCLNATTTASSSLNTGAGSSDFCPIWEICGMQSATGPYQSYRFITAMFIHAGVIHLLFNVLAQLTLVVQVEKILGTPAFALIYFAGGIGGNLLGGNFGLMSPALGASGAVYTAVGVEMTDLILNWHWEARRKTRLTISVVFAVIGLALGLLPGLDNFSHIGGFICGILGGLAFGPSIHPSAKHRVGVWVVRLVALGLMVGFFVGLTTNFFKSDDPTQACRWCRYLSAETVA
ncbi:hypothetical protein OC834_004395 [Tilletia horrida]|nr:hypothetical protein OC834_004395 [Tilletia horrida]